MPIGKKIHNVISKKWKSREDKAPTRPSTPVTVNQSQKNVTSHARPQNVHITVAARKVSKTEGAPTVNGKSGEEVTKKNVHKVRGKKKRVKAGDAAIKPKAAADESSAPKRKRGRPRKKTSPKSSGPSIE